MTYLEKQKAKIYFLNSLLKYLSDEDSMTEALEGAKLILRNDTPLTPMDMNLLFHDQSQQIFNTNGEFHNEYSAPRCEKESFNFVGLENFELSDRERLILMSAIRVSDDDCVAKKYRHIFCAAMDDEIEIANQKKELTNQFNEEKNALLGELFSENKNDIGLKSPGSYSISAPLIEKIKQKMDELQDSLFQSFKDKYLAKYSKEFFKNPFSAMRKKLLKNTITTLEEVEAYCSAHPNSRSAKVINSLKEAEIEPKNVSHHTKKR